MLSYPSVAMSLPTGFRILSMNSKPHFPSAELLNGAQTLGLNLAQSQLEQFQSFFELLLEWNSAHNLTRIKPENFVGLHCLDSLLGADLLVKSNCETVMDLGCGAGFPGIPLKIALPHLDLTLLDAKEKNLFFLEQVISRLKLEKVSLIHGRAEETKSHGQFDCVTARAVADLKILAKWMLPFLRPGGIGLAYKSANIDEELKEAREITELKIEEVRKTIPGTDIGRSIVVIKR